VKIKNIDYQKENHVGLITIDHPPANAWNLQTTTSFGDVLDKVSADKDIRAVVITGAGNKFFSAGLDIKDAKNKKMIGPMGRNLWNKVERIEKPTIAAINGHAYGGGLELALACHFRIMEKDGFGRIGLTELNVGIIPGWGGTHRLKKIVGVSRALELILFSKTLDSTGAFAAGIVNELAEPGQLLARAMEMAQILAERPPLAVQWTLKAMLAGEYEGPHGAYNAEAIGSEITGRSEDCKEGFAAFVEKRKPQYKGI
jgi:enoyl-CoA hydratase/carnithine racemase